jgi:hypothetical protein
MGGICEIIINMMAVKMAVTAIIAGDLGVIFGDIADFSE